MHKLTVIRVYIVINYNRCSIRIAVAEYCFYVSCISTSEVHLTVGWFRSNLAVEDDRRRDKILLVIQGHINNGNDTPSSLNESETSASSGHADWFIDCYWECVVSVQSFRYGRGYWDNHSNSSENDGEGTWIALESAVEDGTTSFIAATFSIDHLSYCTLRICLFPVASVLVVDPADRRTMILCLTPFR